MNWGSMPMPSPLCVHPERCSEGQSTGAIIDHAPADPLYRSNSRAMVLRWISEDPS